MNIIKLLMTSLIVFCLSSCQTVEAPECPELPELPKKHEPTELVFNNKDDYIEQLIDYIIELKTDYDILYGWAESVYNNLSLKDNE